MDTKKPGRQRYDFTDADVTVSVAGVPNVPGGGGVTGADFVQAVELVDEQFRQLMAAITAGGPGSGYVGSPLFVPPPTPKPPPAPPGKTVPRGTPAVPPPIPTLRVIQLVEIIDPQFKKLLATIAGMPGGAGGGQANPNTPRLSGEHIQRHGLWSEFGNLFKQANRLTNPKAYRAGRLKVKRTGVAPIKRGRALSAGGGVLGKAGGGILKGVGGVLGKAGGGILKGVGGGLMKAAGPVGIAFTVADVAAKTLASGFQIATAGVKLFGEAAVKVAGNDGIGLITTGLRAASEALGKIPIVGQVFAAGLELATAGLNTFQSVLKAFTARGRELARYNPRIALAAATADVRKIFADIREANQNAGKYADLIRKQQDIDEQFQKALQPLKEAVTDILIKVAPLVEQAANDLGQMLQYLTGGKMGGGYASLPAQLSRYQDLQLEQARELNKNNAEILKLIDAEFKRRAEEKNMASAFPQMLFNAADAIQLEDFVDPVNNQGGNKLNFPIRMGP